VEVAIHDKQEANELSLDKDVNRLKTVRKSRSYY
jgi:hypothetical protein